MDKEISTAVGRVRRMERIFDTLLENKDSVFSDTELLKKYKSLVRYYQGGKWLQDYALDEKGLLPPTLKRGVLSEDGVYNLITDMENID